MISYYVYGRGKSGYVNYNPDYSKTDEETFFSKMTDYTPCTSDVQDMPEKLFCYQMRSQQNGNCAIVGQTSLVKGLSTKLSGDRDTVFSFQYLFGGMEEQKLWENPFCMSALMPFPVCMDQICDAVTGEVALTHSGMVQDAGTFHMDSMNVPADIYSMQELLDTFAMDDERLKDFLYALLLFNTNEKLYLMLPENSRCATQMAFAFMQKVLGFLPETIARRTGFVTYVNKADTAFADYVPFEIRCMFLANTQENVKACRQTKAAFVFCRDCDTGVEVPAELKELVEELAVSFRSGSRTVLVQDLWTALETYLKRDVDVPISTVEYAALFYYCSLKRSVRGEGQVPHEDDVWKTVDVLRSMSRERTQLWNDQLAEDTAAFVTEFIDNDWPDGADNYARLISEYKNSDIQKTVIERFFCRQVGEYGQLESCLRRLASCEELQKNVSKQCENMFVEQLRNGDVDDAVLPAVFALYNEEPNKRGIIQEFFVRQIVDMASLAKYREIILKYGSHGQMGALWNNVESSVYADAGKQYFLADVECQGLLNRLSAGGLAEKIGGFWGQVERLKRLNASILQNENYMGTAAVSIPRLFSAPNNVQTVYHVLTDSAAKLQRFRMPVEYTNIFRQASEQYIIFNKTQIVNECENADLFVHWPFGTNSRDMEEILALLTNKGMQNEQRDQFEQVVAEARRVNEISRFLRNVDQASLQSLQNHPNLPEIMKQITTKLEREVCAASDYKIAYKIFQELCGLLADRFPNCRVQIFDYVMCSRMGGIASMADLYSALKKSRNAYGDMGACREAMGNSIRHFFCTYKMSKADKKEIKWEADFLENIGLDGKELKRL